jgi:hypothetical protein
VSQLEKPDSDPVHAGDYPPDAVPPRCDWQCNAARKRAGRVCIYWMTYRPSTIYTKFPSGKKQQAWFGYAKARWVYFDQWGCYMPPPPHDPLLQLGIADYHWRYDTQKPADLQQAWKEAKSGLMSAGAPPAGTIQPFGEWLQSVQTWASDQP